MINLRNHATRWLIMLVLLAGTAWPGTAGATELPGTVEAYLINKDAKVSVRFDGMIQFGNGQRYLPVIPQDPGVNAEPQAVVKTYPENVDYPDLIQFDNNYFLIRLVTTSAGRLTLPDLAEVPIALKEGMLPQDLLLPENLFIPQDLKVILGSLPYNPQFVPEKTPTPAPVKTPSGGARKPAPKPTTGKPAEAQVSKAPTAAPVKSRLFINSSLDHMLTSMDPATGQVISQLDLNCVPANMISSADGKRLFVACLSTDETVVVDTEANLVKTRIPVGKRPHQLLYLADRNEILVSNRFSPFISSIDAEHLTDSVPYNLPGNGGVMARLDKNRMLVADAFLEKLYIYNLETHQVDKTLRGLPGISALWVQPLPGPGESFVVWAISRTHHKAVALDLVSDTHLAEIEVGRKPVAFLPFANTLQVLCAGSDEVDVIDLASRSVVKRIALPAESFPSDLALAADREHAYVTAAAQPGVWVLDLPASRVDTVLKTEIQGQSIAVSAPQMAAVSVTPVSAPTEKPKPAEQLSVPMEDPELLPMEAPAR
ncbi:MAG: YncE family protein [Candidatus Melainabacteria bacterium]